MDENKELENAQPEVLEGEPTPQEGQESDPENSEGESLTPQQLAELKRKAKVSSQNFERAKKAEAELKELKDSKANAVNGMSLADIRALSDVHDDDVEEVIDYAKLKNISLAEAKKKPFIQNLMRTKAEYRKSQEVSNTRERRTYVKDTPDAIIEKANSGQLSDSDEDIRKLVEAEMAVKLRRIQK